MGLSCSHSEGHRVAAIARRTTTRVLPVFLIALMAVAMPSPSALAATATGFVTRNGTHLLLDGKPFDFTGLNIYNANSDGWCGAQMNSGPRLDDALTAIGSGKEVIRSWFFQPLAINKDTRQRDWSAFDHTLQVADAHGMQVIATLTDQWGECGTDVAGNGYKTADWYANGYTQVQPGMLESYRDWVADVVARYKDDPRIAFWQLINEAEVTPCPPGDLQPYQTLHDWAADVSGLVKSIDSNHLVSLGTIGSGQCGADGPRYEDLHAIPTIDMCEYHDYGSPNVGIPGDQYNGLQVRIDQCNDLNKPIFVGEAGIIPNDVGGTLQARADAFRTKIEAQFAAGVRGFLAWAWSPQVPPVSTLDNYDIGPGDPALDALIGPTVSAPGETIRVSLTESAGQPTSWSEGTPSGQTISSDGSRVVFESEAPLVSGDTNGQPDIYVRDLQANTVERASVSTTGGNPFGSSTDPVISSDGRFVAFTSTASNLVTGDTNSERDVFVRDLDSDTTTWVSVGFGGAGPNGPSFGAAISATGRYVTFYSSASNLVATGVDTNGGGDIFIRDLNTGTDELVSVRSDGAQIGGGPDFTSSVSSNGRYVVFGHTGPLDPADGNGREDIYLRDRQTPSTTRVSVAVGGGDPVDGSSAPMISDDGGTIAFESCSDDLVTNDANGKCDIFAERTGHPIELVSVGTGGVSANYHSEQPSVSPDGRYVAFSSSASDIMIGVGNGSQQVFLRDLHGTTRLVSTSTAGDLSNASSSSPAVSSGGSFVAFTSYASNLVTGDTNGERDVFRHEVDLSGAQFRLDVTIHGGGTVSSTPGGIDCSATCSADFDAGTDVTLTATPNAIHTFAGWSPSCTQGADPTTCTVTMDAAKTVTVTFDPTISLDSGITFSGASAPGLAGQIRYTGSGLLAARTIGVQLNDSSYIYDNPLLGPDEVTPASSVGSKRIPDGGISWTDTAITITDTVLRGKTADLVVVYDHGGNEIVIFNHPDFPIPSTAIAVDPDTGLSDVAVVAIEGTGLEPSEQVQLQECSASAHTCVGLQTVTADATGAFSTNATVRVDGYGFFTCQQDCTVQAVATSGPFTGQRRGSAQSISFASQESFALTLTKDGTGGGNVSSDPAGIDCGGSCQTTFEVNTQVTLTATPNATSEFSGWSGAGCSGTGTCTFTVDHDRAVTATFTSLLADLSVTTAASPDPASAGNDLTYTVQVANLGPADASTVTLSDMLPVGPVFASVATTQGSCSQASGTVTCNLGNVPNGATETITIVVTPTAVGNITNTATTTSSSPDNITGNNQSARAVSVQGWTCTIIGTQANDTLNGTNGNDTICGLGGKDTISGNNGNDILLGGLGGDSVSGGAGNDSLLGGADADSLDGGNGMSDIARYDFAPAGVTASLTSSSATGGDGTDTLAANTIEGIIGSAFADSLTGDGGTNELNGRAGNDSLFGLAGNDNLIGDAGNDSIDGGVGFDTVRYDSAPTGVTVSLAAGTASGGDGADTFVLNSIEGMVGSSFNDVLTGDGRANIIDGGAGNDTLFGLDGDDTYLLGGAGDDSLQGGNGNDQLVGNAGTDTLNGGSGFDWALYYAAPSGVTVSLTAGTASGGDGNDTLAGLEAILGSNFADTITGDGQANSLCGGNSNVDVNDTVSGLGGDDVLCGAAGNDSLFGGDGNDTLYGDSSGANFTGNDSLFGGNGNDHLYGQAGTDSLDGGVGFDYVHYDSAPVGVTVNLATGAASGGDGADTIAVNTVEGIYGSAFVDTLTGDGAANVLHGGAGNDTLSGLDGNDNLFGQDGDDTLLGGNGNDNLDGGLGTDTCTQGAGTGTVSNCSP
jgi:uncharacterized repeat protein (TIGR01451 family)